MFRVSIFLFFTLSLFSHNIIFTNISEDIYKKNKFKYTITAHKKVENYKKDIKTLFFNRKKYVADNFFYEKGSVVTQTYDIKFNRMFIYAGIIYMSNVKGKVGEYRFNAQKATIYSDTIKFSRFRFQKGVRRGSKRNFIFYLK